MTIEYEDLPAVSEAPLPLSVRMKIVASGSAAGLLAGAVAFGIVEAAVQSVGGVLGTAAAVLNNSEASTPSPASYWLALVTGVIAGLFAAAVAGESVICKRLDAAKFKVHVDMYRGVIEQRMRQEAERRARRRQPS
ncbi:hypothetical protein KIH27_18590 [Mycobacterium sp. M1]|uniref:Transmembrane protein n=1 Tax=Mycolicibacter acidiphilus TaxID=2835306 RepID=A0ABS5RPW0_9MYCO|nr:hypothetical protein [Mycolicibacter acidiphilus]MBS9535598.1 hypothetical protein [Mycolicibacter acidiphilus]